MSEQTQNIEQPQDSTQQGAPTQPEENGGTGKVFTQEDVNRIVSERLAREREKAEPTEIELREQALAAREARFDCREFVSTLPIDGKKQQAILDNLDTSDIDKFKASAKAIVTAFAPHYSPRAGISPVPPSLDAAFRPSDF